MNSSSSLKPPLKPTNKSLIRTTRRLIKKTTLLTENQKDTNKKLSDTNEKLTILLKVMKIDKNNISEFYPAQKDTSNPPCHLKPTKFSALVLMRSQDGLSYPDFSIHMTLTLEELMVMFNMI